MPQTALKPPRLRPGDTIAVVSTSWGGPHLFPWRFDAGLRTLRETFGLRVRELPSARRPPDDLYADPRARADDLNAAFADDDVAAIISSIGGDDSVRVLPFLDGELAARRPKILMGYSDTTTQLLFYRGHGLVTFHGPSVMSGLAQLAELGDDVVDHARTLLFEARDEYCYPGFGRYHVGFHDWADPANAAVAGDCVTDDGPHVLQGAGSVVGPMLGGCIEVLDMLRGTEFWPTGEMWDGALMLLETSEEAPSTDQVGRWLRSYGVLGLFDRVAGVLVGRARDYSPQAKRELDEVVLRVVRDEFGAGGLPVVTNLDFGHTDPQWVLPLGVPTRVDCATGALTLLESPTT